MNLSNALTLSRLLLTLLFVTAFLFVFPGAHLLALGAFALAAATDWLDGYVARRYEMCTNFGRFMDPLADKILVMAALILLIPFHAIPSWIVILIIAREFVVTGLRLVASNNNVMIATARLGKQKTFWQLLTILFYLILLVIADFSNAPWIHWSWIHIGPYLVGITLFFTLYSGGIYLWSNRTLFCTH